MTVTEAPARDGVLVPVGCPNCHTPEGAYPMRIIDTMDDPRHPERWRRSILECTHCRHGVLIEITIANLDQPR